LSLHLVPLSALHPRARFKVVPAAGLLARGSTHPLGLPETQRVPVAGGGVLAAYSCGGSRGIGETPHRVPFYVPHHAGTDDGRTIAGSRATATALEDPH
jgi:hypothetical protein